MLSEVFFTFLITSVIGCLMGMVRMLYKSKCKSLNCFGIKIERDTQSEEKIDELEMQRSNALGNNSLESRK
jgi:hypothetical protein